MNIIWKGSPNFGVTRFGNNIEFIVCHWIVGTLASADAVFANPKSQVSAHYAVGNGEIHQYVKESNTAWHAGNQTVNRKSIGIEHQGGPNIPITDAVYNTSADLIADICRRYGKRFPLRAHREFVATACPGTLDLNKLNRLVDERLNPSKGVIMDTNAGRELYRTGLFREPENDTAGSAGQWNGRSPADALKVLRDAPEWQANAKKVRDYETLAKQVQELSARPTKVELEAITNQLKTSSDKVAELERQVKENPDTVLIDEGKNWLQKLIARLGGK